MRIASPACFLAAQQALGTRGAVGLRPRPPQPPLQGTTLGQQHHEGGPPMGVDGVRGGGVQEARGPIGEGGGGGGGCDRSRVEDGTTTGRGANGGALPLVSLNKEGTVSHGRRGDATGANAKGLMFTRMMAHTRAATITGERANRQPCGASSLQQAVARMTSPVSPLEPVPSQTEPSPRAPPPPQSGKGGPRSTVIRLGPPPTPNPPPEHLLESLRRRW